jgi:branched-chain amino acid aminotransferase
MAECTGNYFIKNGKMLPVEEFDNKIVYEGETIYEILRMVGGFPLFFYDHYARLVGSILNRKQTNLATFNRLLRDIKTLSETEKPNEVNLKIVFNYNNPEYNYLVYFIKASYPTDLQYKEGVKGTLFKAERTDPESKVIHRELKTAIEEKLSAEKAYEALLVNDNNLITEGGRSNTFFIKDKTLYTAPDNLVLGGITRKHLIALCNENGIEIRYECVNADEIQNYNSVFMTGTSPILLPFKTIDTCQFTVENSIVEKLRKIFMLKIEQSINDFISDKQGL